jgi:hypothetical protein
MARRAEKTNKRGRAEAPAQLRPPQRATDGAATAPIAPPATAPIGPAMMAPVPAPAAAPAMRLSVVVQAESKAAQAAANVSVRIIVVPSFDSFQAEDWAALIYGG